MEMSFGSSGIGGGGQTSPLQHFESLSHHGPGGSGGGGSSRSSPANNLIEQLLPGHKIARGRGRRKQLEKMTAAEKLAEKQARMEKMRISARECRLRKKHNIASLESKLVAYEAKDKRNRSMISRLKDEVRRLQDNLRALGHEPKADSSRSSSSTDPARIKNRYETQQQLLQQQQQHQQQQHQQHQQKKQQQKQRARLQQSIGQSEAERQQQMQLQHHVEMHRMQQQQRIKQEQAYGEPMTYNTVHQPVDSMEMLSKPVKIIKTEPSLDNGATIFQMTGARRSSLVVDTAAAEKVGSDLQHFLQQNGGGSMTPITPKMNLDTLLVPGFQLPASPAVANSFNFGEVDQMLLG